MGLAALGGVGAASCRAWHRPSVAGSSFSALCCTRVCFSCLLAMHGRQGCRCVHLWQEEPAQLPKGQHLDRHATTLSFARGSCIAHFFVLPHVDAVRGAGRLIRALPLALVYSCSPALVCSHAVFAIFCSKNIYSARHIARASMPAPLSFLLMMKRLGIQDLFYSVLQLNWTGKSFLDCTSTVKQMEGARLRGNGLGSIAAQGQSR